MKRWFLLLPVLLLLGGFAAAEEAPDPRVSGSWEYVLLEDGTAEIVGFSGEDAEVLIPSGLEGITVSGIGENAFRGNPFLTRMTVPDTVRSVGDSAFADCILLESITLPEGLERIGTDAFSGCSSLENIALPASVNSIGSGAFWDCRSLAAVSVPAGITTLENELRDGTPVPYVP